MTTPDRSTDSSQHPWRGIDLDVYERHMSDSRVGQLQLLRDITRDQLQAYPSGSVAVLGVAGGNGLDLVDAETTRVVYGFDINPDYLRACESRYRDVLGDRLQLIETGIDRFLSLEPVDLVIANLIVEYVGTDEFAAFAGANAPSIGVLSCVIQRNDVEGFVSSTEDASAFVGLASVASDVEPDVLAARMFDAGFETVISVEYPLPNGKTLIRQDFRPITHEQQEHS